jgi:hypothetical protein
MRFAMLLPPPPQTIKTTQLNLSQVKSLLYDDIMTIQLVSFSSCGNGMNWNQPKYPIKPRMTLVGWFLLWNSFLEEKKEREERMTCEPKYSFVFVSHWLQLENDKQIGSDEVNFGDVSFFSFLFVEISLLQTFTFFFEEERKTT